MLICFPEEPTRSCRMRKVFKGPVSSNSRGQDLQAAALSWRYSAQHQRGFIFNQLELKSKLTATKWTNFFSDFKNFLTNSMTLNLNNEQNTLNPDLLVVVVNTVTEEKSNLYHSDYRKCAFLCFS
ncbi:hypothetical protein AMECASPLE_004025 [Ameca splendens]|uniref:Uncharacterized protein n=1 Tax=Ameca splendens TaxID=208324 RepID=A0ABV0XYJ1_9TELE